MVGDGNGAVPPAGGRGDGVACLGQRVHHGHGRVQMQLDALLLGRVLALGRFALHDGKGLDDHLLGIFVIVELALHAQPAARLFHAVGDRLARVALEKSADARRTGIVGHVKIHDRGRPLAHLAVVDGKHASLDDDAFILKLLPDLTHRQRLALKGLAVDHLRAVSLLRLRLVPGGELRLRQLGGGHAAHLLRLSKHVPGRVAAGQLDLRLHAEALAHIARRCGQIRRQRFLSEGRKMQAEPVRADRPRRPGQHRGRRAEGVDQDGVQLVRVDVRERLRRKLRMQQHLVHAVERRQLPLRPFDGRARHIVGEARLQRDALMRPVNRRVADLCRLQRLAQRILRAVFVKQV